MEVKTITVAFGSVPKDGGTFTFYRNLRPALKLYGIDLRCVTVGKREMALVEKEYVDEGCVFLAEKTNDIKKQAIVFTQWCQENNIDIVMAINSIAILSALPHLPKSIRVISRCANAFDQGYRVTMSGRERLMAIVALTPRLKKDLVEKYDADPNLIHLIPNGIDPRNFADALPRLCKPNSLIQLGFLGRLEHKQKGVLYLPEIVKELKALGVNFHLRIAGKGIHRSLLEKELKPYVRSKEVEFLGAIMKDEVPDFLKSTDIFLFTSHFEGCPNALLEAMMAGCTPVAFLIEGITDFVLDHDRTGFIAPMGDCQIFARYVAKMENNPTILEQISKATLKKAHEHFSSSIAAKNYANLFEQVMNLSLPEFEPIPWSEFEIDPTYRKTWKSYLPLPLKVILKKYLVYIKKTSY